MIEIIVTLIDLCNPLKNMCDVPFVSLSYLDLQASLLQTGVKVQENVILDSFAACFLDDLFHG